MKNVPDWSPLGLSEQSVKYIKIFNENDRERKDLELETVLINKVVDVIDLNMQNHVVEIIEKDGLPHLCHIINGWGNCLIGDKTITEHLAGFVHYDDSGKSYIYQCDPEGDFHPWQTFAYSAMAGISSDTKIADTEVSYGDLMNGSKIIQTDDGIELGHLLFAIGYYHESIHDTKFSFCPANGEPFEMDLYELMKQAVYAHYHGEFTVCRKFHLTEGLMAVTAKVPGMDEFKPFVEEFLRGQLEILPVLGTILSLTELALNETITQEQQDALNAIRKEMVMGDLIENQIYYAGHTIELACFAMIDGYAIEQRQIDNITYIINTLNKIIYDTIHEVTFSEAFLGLGHYRRSITLFEQITKEKFNLTNISLDAYTCNFDLQKKDHKPSVEHNVVKHGVFTSATPNEYPDDKFDDVLSNYNAKASGPWVTRGNFVHFRRIGPSSWPRSCHYEFLAEENTISAEIHLERDELKFLRPTLESFESKIADQIPTGNVYWDPQWSKNRGKLVVQFDREQCSSLIASAMNELISQTSSIIEDELRTKKLLKVN